jgi:predicted HicB family RNase H-like nuclease
VSPAAQVALTVRIPADLHRALAALARADASSINRHATIALRAHVAANRKGKK